MQKLDVYYKRKTGLYEDKYQDMSTKVTVFFKNNFRHVSDLTLPEGKGKCLGVFPLCLRRWV